jgi:hypothetical protein
LESANFKLFVEGLLESKSDDVNPAPTAYIKVVENKNNIVGS